MTTMRQPIKNAPLREQRGSRSNVESNGEKEVSTNPYFSTGTKSSISVIQPELRLSHTTRFSPRQAEAAVDSDINVNVSKEHFKFGSSTRFLPQQAHGQVSFCSDLANEGPPRPSSSATSIPDDNHQSSSTNNQKNQH